MMEQAKTEQLIAHLIDEARRIHDASEFTIRLMPGRGRIGIQFKVKHDTPAKRPPTPPNEIRPEQWENNVGEVVSDMEDQMHMTWSWPEEQPERDAMTTFAAKHAEETGLNIQVS